MVLFFKQLIITEIKMMLGVDVQIRRQEKNTADSFCCSLHFYLTLSSTDSQIALLMFVDPPAMTEACLPLSTFAGLFPPPPPKLQVCGLSAATGKVRFHQRQSGVI